MDTAPDEVEQFTEASAEVAYRWAIRLLYATAIGLNVYLIWGQVKDTPEAAELAARFEAWRTKALQPLTDRKHFRRQSNRVLYEAIEIVEGAA